MFGHINQDMVLDLDLDRHQKVDLDLDVDHLKFFCVASLVTFQK